MSTERLRERLEWLIATSQADSVAELTHDILMLLGIPADADLKPFHKVGRMDDESVDGEHTWNVCEGGPDDWTTPENCHWDEPPTVYYIDSYLRISHVERTFGEREPDDDDDELDHDARMALLGIVRARLSGSIPEATK